MTLTEISSVAHNEPKLTIPELPEEYLEIITIDDDETDFEKITESYPLAVSDVITADILDAKKLTKGEGVKEVYSIDLNHNFESYQPGDTVGIITHNPDEAIQKLFSHLKITNLANKKCKVCLKTNTIKSTLKPVFLDRITTLSYIFTHFLDIFSIPKKSLIRILSEFTKDSKEKRYLEELCSKEKSDLYTKHILESNVTFLDLLMKFPSCCPPIVRLLEQLPKLQPRPYSIASSPLGSLNSLKIVFSVIEIEAGIKKHGLCTGMLKNLINQVEDGKKVKMFLRKCNGFNPPENNVPLILIGPGTGIAPFMGFLEDRKLQNKKGIIWLFYGCRHKSKDFLFQQELEEYVSCEVLSKLLVAFSRDNEEGPKYVQDNLRKYGKEICELIFEQNAMIYVCGDAKNMRKDIQNAFIEILENNKGMTSTEASNCLKKLQKEKRYLQDIWL